MHIGQKIHDDMYIQIALTLEEHTGDTEIAMNNIGNATDALFNLIAQGESKGTVYLQLLKVIGYAHTAAVSLLQELTPEESEAI